MATNFSSRALVTRIDYVDHSVYGNPRYRLVVNVLNGNRVSVMNPIIVFTSPNSSLAYGISNYIGKFVEFSWKRDRKDRIVLQSIDELTDICYSAIIYDL